MRGLATSLAMLAFLALGPGTEAAAARKVRIPKALKGVDREVAAGSYGVELARDTQGTWIQLTQGGSTVLRELAVKPVRQPRGRGHRVWTSLDRRQEQMLRVYWREGPELFLAVFELAR